MSRRSGEPESKRGRPRNSSPILNENLIKAIADSVAVGNYFKIACEFNGVPEATAYTWLHKGQREVEVPLEDASLYRKFAQAIARAAVEWEQNAVALVMDAATNDWRAALEILKRKAPERWGDSQKLKIDQGAVAAFTQSVITVVKQAINDNIPDPATRSRVTKAILVRLAEIAGDDGRGEQLG